MIILRQKEFANFHYANLNSAQKAELRSARKNLARQLLQDRKSALGNTYSLQQKKKNFPILYKNTISDYDTALRSTKEASNLIRDSISTGKPVSKSDLWFRTREKLEKAGYPNTKTEYYPTPQPRKLWAPGDRF
jgi:hypothetical protein